MVFPVLVNYSLRMLPCVLAGLLLLRTSSMQKNVMLLSAYCIYQGFIIAMSTTLRYFPALKEEFVHKCCEIPRISHGHPAGVYGSH